MNSNFFGNIQAAPETMMAGDRRIDDNPHSSRDPWEHRKIAAKIISQKRIDANRENSAKSTGPKTKLGKSKSRFNALKFGAFAKQPLIIGECECEHAELVRKIVCELSPKTIIESMLVDQILSDLWRLNRLEKATRAYFEQVQESAYIRLLRSLSAREFRETKCLYTDAHARSLSMSAKLPESLKSDAHSPAGSSQCANPNNLESNKFSHRNSVDDKLDRLDDPGTVLLDAMAGMPNDLPLPQLERMRERFVRGVLRKHAHLLKLQALRHQQRLQRSEFLHEMPIAALTKRQ